MNTDTIRQWWATFVGNGGMVEVRVIGERRFSGYFKSLDNLLQCVEPYTKMDNEQVYFTLNEIYPKLYERPQCEKILETKLESKDTTKDPDIIRRKWVLVDFDPVRPTKVSSTADELKAADTKMREVFRFLRDKGFSEPVVACSGNGYHLDFAVDLPNDESTREILRKFFAYLRQEFNDDKVDIDPKNFNASRVCKLYGTMAKKGDNTDERPWRESAIIHIPKEIKPTPIEHFEELAKMVKEAPRPTPTTSQYRSGQFSLTEWLTAHGINYREKRNGLSTMYELEWCPWVETHSEKKRWDSALFQDPDGKITFNCHHAHCEGKTWQDVRLFYEPDAYDRQWQQRQTQPVMQKPEPQEADEKRGNVWQSFAEIEDEDRSKVISIKSGIIQYDKECCGFDIPSFNIWSGNNGSAKSTLLNQIALNAVNQGYKTAIYSGEMRGKRLKRWMVLQAAGRRHNVKSNYNAYDYYTPNMVKDKIVQWLDGKMFNYNTKYSHDIGVVCTEIERIVSEQGVTMVIADNLSSLDIDSLHEQLNEQQKAAVKMLMRLTEELNIVMHLVVHPKKSEGFLRKNDVSGTKTITDLADNVFFAHRWDEDTKKAAMDFLQPPVYSKLLAENPTNIIEVVKHREFGEAVGHIYNLYYESESKRLKNSPDEDIAYGWEERSEQSEITLPPMPYEPLPYNKWDEPLEPLYTPTDQETPF